MLNERLNEIFSLYPFKNALEQDQKSVTYGELAALVTEKSEWLSKSGVMAGEVVVLYFDSGIDFIVALLACVRVKAVVFPVAIDFSDSETLQIVERIKPAYIFASSDYREKLKHLELLTAHDDPEGRSVLLETHCECTFLPPEMRKGGFIRFSSGTTGASKGVCISHQSALERVDAVRKTGLIKPDDRIVVMLPLPHHFVVSLFLFLTEASTIIIPDKGFSSFNLIENFRPTTFYAAPFQLELIVRHLSHENSIRHFISTSMPLSSQTAELCFKRTGAPVVQVLGNIETGLPFVNLRMAASDPVLLGDLIPDFEVKLIDENGKEVAEGEPGTAYLRGPGMFDCYLSPYAPRAELSRDGWFTTGDVLIKESSGAYRFCGRVSSALNIAGHKVFPEEIEEVLLTFPGISKARVSGRGHELFGTVLKAEIVYEVSEVPSTRELRMFLRQRLAPYKIPSSYEMLTELPETITGKVRREVPQEVDDARTDQ